MEVTLEQIQDSAKEALEVLERIQRVHVPVTVKAAINEDWITVGQEAGEGFLSHVSKEQLKEWDSRVISVRAANGILRGFEQAVVENYVGNPKHPVAQAIKRMAEIPKFILGNIVLLWNVVLPLVAKVVSGGFEIQVMRVEMEKLDDGLRTLSPNDRNRPRYEHEREVLNNQITDYDKLLVDGLLAVLAVATYFCVEDLLKVGGSVAAVASNLGPSLKGRDLAQDFLPRLAFPQTSGARVRRRKRSR